MRQVASRVRAEGIKERAVLLSCTKGIEHGTGLRMMPTPPLMHGAAQWAAFICMTGGGTLVMQGNTRSLDPADVWRTVERERVQSVTVVGDADRGMGVGSGSVQKPWSAVPVRTRIRSPGS